MGVRALDLAIWVVAGSVADSAVCTELVRACVEGFGGIDVMVNNAGYGLAGRFSKLDGERMRKMVTLHCAAPVVLAHALLPGMLDRPRRVLVFQEVAELGVVLLANLHLERQRPLRDLALAGGGRFAIPGANSISARSCGPR